MLPQSVLIGLVVAVVGYFLQQRSWRQKNFEEIRRLEFDECLKLIDDLGSAIDRRLMETSKYSVLAQRGDHDEEVESAFRESISSWMGAFSSRKSKIYHYYGRQEMLRFENVVHSELQEVAEILKRAKRLGLQNLSTEHRKETLEIGGRLDVARHKAFKFLSDLNERLSSGDIGRTSLFNNIYEGQLEDVSRIYLFERLFAIKS